MGDSGGSPQNYTVEVHHEFESQPPEYHKRRRSSIPYPDAIEDTITLSEIWVGLAIDEDEDRTIRVGIASHDGTYSADFATYGVCPESHCSNEQRGVAIEKLIISCLSKYRVEHLCKILGAGLSLALDAECPRLCSRLWAELDIVPVVLRDESNIMPDGGQKDVDELADSMARKCVMYYGPNKQPCLSISDQNQVLVDADGRIKLSTMAEYERSVRDPTWRAVAKLIEDVKDRDIRIAFFSATPQGGGVALMRHALLRFLQAQGVKIEWYVPKPRPGVFQITKTNHNILQGAVPPRVYQSDEQLQQITSWIEDNATRYWLKDKGPLRAPSEGGADVIIVDDPQMPNLIPLAKQQAPNRPVIFRSHIEVRDDLVQEEDSAAQHVWNWMWASIKQADLFVSHPVKSFVPSTVKKEMIAYMPATTDWLDGLNKHMAKWDLQYYFHLLRQQCHSQGLPQLDFPKRPYIAQIARFDPAKGIPDVIKSYAKLCRDLMKGVKREKVPQLILTGHSSVDDPDGSAIYDQTMSLIENEFSDLKNDIVVVRLQSGDQLINAVLSKAHVVLQLSTREGFEVKVSEALHKGKPVIVTEAGGIPLQVEHGKSGFVVKRNDADAVAGHMHDLFMDPALYKRMSEYAAYHVSDEVSTVGNAVSWLYLASAVAGGKELQPNGRWVNDMAREAVGEQYKESEPRLPRHLST